MGKTYEQTTAMSFKDSDGNTYKIYPITKNSNVIGLSEDIRNQSVVTTGTGETYLANVPGITSLSVGASFVMIPHVDSTTTGPKLNVNSLGEKNIRRRTSANIATTVAGYSSDWLTANKPIRVTYDGTFWIAELQKPHASDLFGTVSIENGGTGGKTSADARKNLGAASVTAKTLTLSATNWSNKTQTITATGVTASNIVIVSPAPVSYVAYGEAGVRCTGQAANSLTFSCEDTPSVNLTISAVVLE